jgi:hypothetical protein
MPAEPTQKMREQAGIGASPPQFGQRRFSFGPLGSLAHWCRESCPQPFTIISDGRSGTIGSSELARTDTRLALYCLRAAAGLQWQGFLCKNGLDSARPAGRGGASREFRYWQLENATDTWLRHVNQSHDRRAGRRQQREKNGQLLQPGRRARPYASIRSSKVWCRPSNRRSTRTPTIF